MSAPARRCSAIGLAAALAGAGLLGGASPDARAERTAISKAPFRVLVYSRTTGFRHQSIPFGIAAVQSLGRNHGFAVDATEDPEQIVARRLRRYAAVIFLNTTGNVLEAPQRHDLKRFVRAGGGFVGIHSAADTEYDWSFYERLVGARFKNHPIQQLAEFTNEAPDHPATRHLPERFPVFDEFYAFTRNPRPRVRVLLTIDEGTYMPDPNTGNLPGGKPSTGYMGDHPMSWCHRVRRGRSFYTELGHEPYLYLERWYQRHLLGGIRMAARRVRADCSPS